MRNIFNSILLNFNFWNSEIKFESIKFQKSSIIDPFDISNSNILKSFPNLKFEIEIKSMIDLYFKTDFFKKIFKKLNSYLEEEEILL